MSKGRLLVIGSTAVLVLLVAVRVLLQKGNVFIHLPNRPCFLRWRFFMLSRVYKHIKKQSNYDHNGHSHGHVGE